MRGHGGGIDAFEGDGLVEELRAGDDEGSVSYGASFKLDDADVGSAFAVG